MIGSGPEDSRSDQQLVAAVNAGDAEAFEVLYLRYRDWVVALAYRFTGSRDEALDVMQEVFLYFLGKFPGFKLTAQLKTFLYPAVKHLAIRGRQKARRLAPGEDAIALAPAPRADDPADVETQTRQQLATVMAALPAAQREVVLMRYVDGLALAEIAQAMKIPLGTVKSRLHHALAALRQDARTRKYFLT